MRQEMVVIGNEWNFGCCAERREFSIVRIFDEGKVVGIDTAGKLSFWAKEISELHPNGGAEFGAKQTRSRAGSVRSKPIENVFPG